MTNEINNTIIQSNKKIIIKSPVLNVTISSCVSLEFVSEEDFFHKERILFSRYIDIRTAIITARI